MRGKKGKWEGRGKKKKEREGKRREGRKGEKKRWRWMERRREGGILTPYLSSGSRSGAQNKP